MGYHYTLPNGFITKYLNRSYHNSPLQELTLHTSKGVNNTDLTGGNTSQFYKNEDYTLLKESSLPTFKGSNTSHLYKS